MTPEQARQAAYGPWEFHSEKWELAYTKRIDATIAALNACKSAAIFGRPPSERDFQRQYRRKPARCHRTRVSGRTIVMALRTDGNHRYSWMKNKRSSLVSRTRPRTLRRNMISRCRSAAFSVWFPTIPSGGIRAVRQNQRIIRCDARDPPFADHTCRRFVQVAAQA